MATETPDGIYEIERPTGLVRPSIELLAFGLIFVAAALMRFGSLDNVPLSPAEAKQALAVWDLWRPDPAAADAGSAAYYALTSLVVSALGFSDATMRLVPAVFGLLTVGLPWFLRHRLGLTGALVVSALLAVSPLHAITARTAGGQAMALFAGLLLFIAWLRYQETGQRIWLTWFFVALALGLCSAPLFYSIALAVLLAWMAQIVISRRAPSTEELGLFQDPRLPRLNEFWLALLPGLAVFVLLCTTFFLDTGNLGAFARTAADWLSLFGLGTTTQANLASFLAIPSYEPALLILGLASVVWALWRPVPMATLLLLWLSAAAILSLLQPDQLQTILLLTLPGYMLVGCFVDAILRRRRGWTAWAAAAGFLLVGAVVYANLVRVARLSVGGGNVAVSYYTLIAALAVIAALIFFLLLWSWNRDVAGQGAVVALLVLVLVDVWGTSWWMTRYAGNDTRLAWVDIASDNDLALLSDSVAEVSWQLTNSPTELRILSSVNDPALRWYLRDMRAVEFVSVIPRSTESQALITPLGTVLTLDADYIGADFGYTRSDTQVSRTLEERLRWWLFHESPVPVNEERLVLWIRSDLIGQLQ